MVDDFERKVFQVQVDYDPDSGELLAERWKNQFGYFERLADLPAVTEYCPNNGAIVHQRWHHGDCPQGPHRDGDKPARIRTDPKTGFDVEVDYMKLGNYHRDGDQPAEIVRYQNGVDEEHVYWQFGKKHRSPDIGPAVIRFDQNGNVLETEYWVNDRQIQTPGPINKLDI